MDHGLVLRAEGTGGGTVIGFGLLGVLFAATAMLSGTTHHSVTYGGSEVVGAAEKPVCPTGSPQSGDVDGDGGRDNVTAESVGDDSWLVRVQRASGGTAEVQTSSECATLLGLADVNGDRREEIWFKDGIGNTAHTFDLIAWTGETLRVIVGSNGENPLVVGWGFSGGATLWCADATGDGRPDIVRYEFRRGGDGSPYDEREFVYELRDNELREIYQGSPRTLVPESSTLTCGPVAW
jgi:hypothetical protein